jgi:hypothetical protein
VSNDRRLYAMDLGRRDRTRWLGVHRVSSRLTLPTANLIAAYDARAGVTNDGSGLCSAWADQSGNGFNATQGTSGKRPTITTTGGFASLQFDGSADALGFSSLSASAGVKTIYAVVNPTTVGSAYRFLFDANAGRLGFGILASGKWGVFDGIDRDSGITAATGLQRLSTEVVTGSSRVWCNGTAGAATGWTASPALNVVSAVGAFYNAGVFYFAGHICALYIYGAARNTAVEAYITQEWGV